MEKSMYPVGARLWYADDPVLILGDEVRYGGFGDRMVRMLFLEDGEEIWARESNLREEPPEANGWREGA